MPYYGLPVPFSARRYNVVSGFSQKSGLFFQPSYRGIALADEHQRPSANIKMYMTVFQNSISQSCFYLINFY
jgi:hypothetical protein